MTIDKNKLAERVAKTLTEIGKEPLMQLACDFRLMAYGPATEFDPSSVKCATMLVSILVDSGILASPSDAVTAERDAQEKVEAEWKASYDFAETQRVKINMLTLERDELRAERDALRAKLARAGELAAMLDAYVVDSVPSYMLIEIRMGVLKGMMDKLRSLASNEPSADSPAAQPARTSRAADAKMLAAAEAAGFVLRGGGDAEPKDSAAQPTPSTISTCPYCHASGPVFRGFAAIKHRDSCTGRPMEWVTNAATPSAPAKDVLERVGERLTAFKTQLDAIHVERRERHDWSGCGVCDRIGTIFKALFPEVKAETGREQA